MDRQHGAARPGGLKSELPGGRSGGQAGQWAKQQWVMRQHEVRTATASLVEHCLGYVEADQYVGDLVVGVADLQADGVPRSGVIRGVAGVDQVDPLPESISRHGRAD